MFSFTFEDIGRIVLVGISAYAALILFLRISGKRTLSKMNAFDLIITVALGSTLATILLDKDISLIEGITALFLLVLLQYIVAWLSVRVAFFNKLIKSEPQLIYFQNEFLGSAMKKERILESEIYQASRTQGFASMEEVEAVILETDGSISILPKEDVGKNQSTTNDVSRIE